MNKKIISSTLALSLTLSGFLIGGKPVSAEEVRIAYHEAYQTPSYMIEQWEAPKGLSKVDIVLAYLDSKSKSFKLSNNTLTSFKVLEETTDKETDTSHFRVKQYFDGIPVFGADQTVALDHDNQVKAYFGQVIPNLDNKNLKTEAKVTKGQAVSIFKQALEKRIGEVGDYEGVEVKEYIYEYDDNFYYTYLVTASTVNPKVGYWHYFIDAVSGDVVDQFNAAHEVTAFGTGVFGEKRKFEAQAIDGLFRLYDETRGKGVVTYDQTTNTNVDVTSVNKMFKDGAAVDAHRNAQLTYDYYMDTFGRDSVDNNGQQLISAVHVGDNWNNASWNGRQMSYGDGDGIRFHPLSAGLDVAAHEMTHGVVQHTAGLIYRNESGALNESFADIFGAMVDRDNWLIGEAIMADGNHALRDMQDPTSLIESRTERSYPDHWDLRYEGNLDNGGVHINSSINNKAAYLIAEGGEHYGVTVNGVGREATEQIYYHALSYYLTANSSFSMMKQAAIQSATDLYGSNSAEVEAVKHAYNSVGVE
ncbi:M4 family metallopeptidase [Virgibacillus soli]|uniref:Neutral metalloproteinase n=1 Tax=Paracerasibacillus soli TaxID=480284 RepID=A0ABU5CTX1_9BACI|nr:M4 family metallopeptidase [Virgibacillus soli]MDY0409289.1 M4 family metallopeptidase [Virgibacillus soli]